MHSPQTGVLVEDTDFDLPDHCECDISDKLHLSGHCPNRPDILVLRNGIIPIYVCEECIHDDWDVT